jgi:hypothetical protein
MAPNALADLGRYTDVLTLAVRSASRNGTSHLERVELAGKLRDALAQFRAAGGTGKVVMEAEKTLSDGGV